MRLPAKSERRAGAFAEKPMKERDILRFEGPFGSFFLRDDSTKPIVFVASGTGFGTRLAITPRPPSLHYYQPDHAGGD